MEIFSWLFRKLQKSEWDKTPTPLLRILHKRKFRLCKSKQSLVPHLHSNNQHILFFYTFPWHHRQTPCSPAAHPGSTHCISCFFLLLQEARTRLKHPLHTSNFFLLLNLLVSAQKNWQILLLSVVTAYCIYGELDAKGSVISYNAGGRRLEPAKIGALILNDPKTIVPNPLTLCATGNSAGKVNENNNFAADQTWRLS